jgi:hypothetical protein
MAAARVRGVLSLAIGNITAIAHPNLKRMLAYSTIGHMGFLLLGVLAGDAVGYSAGMFYVVVYVLMNLGAFGMIMLLSRAGFEADNLDDFKGLNQRPIMRSSCCSDVFRRALPPTVALREAGGAAGGRQRESYGSRCCSAVLADRGLLLPAARQTHVFRCAHGHGAYRAPSTCAC